MKARDVVIRTVLNGWICNVGCQLLVFMDKEVMLEELSIYLTHPEGTEKRFQEESVNAKQFRVVDCDAEGVPREQDGPETESTRGLRREMAVRIAQLQAELAEVRLRVGPTLNTTPVYRTSP